MSIPSIDLQSFLNGNNKEQKYIANEVDDICRNIGFLIIENHGIADNIIEPAWEITRKFFDLPLEEKLQYHSDDPACPRGYFPMAAEALAKSLGVETPPDIKESFGIGPLRAPEHHISATEYEFHFGENFWPTRPDGFQRTLTNYFNAMEKLGAEVLQLFAAALELPYDYFAQYHTHPMCALRCINYPYSSQELLPEQKGAGEHSDYGSLTMLKADPHVPGLEVKLASGEWAPAPLVDDAFIINIGDMLARWTNDRWVSTMHRVINPGMENNRRQSMAFFHNTNYDARIECIPTCLSADEDPKYAPVQAGEYLIQRFTSAVEE